MITSNADVVALMATRPKTRYIANLFTITLLSGPVYRFTDWPTPVTVGSVQFLPGPPRIGRGQVKLERGMAIDSTRITLQEANGAFITLVAQGFLNRAFVLQQRVFAADQSFAWIGPITRFFGRVADIAKVTRSSVELTVKSAVNDLDNDFPRSVLMPSCDRVLYDAGCTVNPALYEANLTALAGCTRNTLNAAVPQPAPYYDQGHLTWTSGVMAGISYMVKTTGAGAAYPAYPFLTVPAVGDSFNLFAGCDKSQATCTNKFNNLANFTGAPYVPDPTLTYG